MPENVEAAAESVIPDPPLAAEKPDPVAEEKARFKKAYDLPSDDTDEFEIVPVKPEAKKTEVIAENPAPPKHSRLLRKAAIEAGIDEEDLDDATGDDIRTAIAARQAAGVEKARKSQEKPAAAEEEFDWGEIEDEDRPGKMRKVFEEEVSPGIVKNIKAQAKKQKELEARLAGLSQSDDDRRKQVVFSEIDDAFESIGNDAMFGKGRLAQIHPESDEYNRRGAIVKVALGMPEKEGSLKVRIAKAAKLFGAPAVGESDEVLEARKKEWSGAAVAKPTARREAKKVLGDDAAIKKVAELTGARAKADGDDDNTY